MVDQTVTRRVIAEFARRRPATPAPAPGASTDQLLTSRETEIVRLLAEGLSNAEIGVRLHLGTGTVREHVSALLAKLRVVSRIQAALLAQRAGLLDAVR